MYAVLIQRPSPNVPDDQRVATPAAPQKRGLSIYLQPRIKLQEFSHDGRLSGFDEVSFVEMAGERPSRDGSMAVKPVFS